MLYTPEKMVASFSTAKLRNTTAPLGLSPLSTFHLCLTFRKIQCHSSVLLHRVMEDDADCMTVTRADAAYTVPEIDAVHTARALHRAVMDGENNCVTLPKWYDFWPRLHARALFRQHEFTTCEITFRFGQ